MKNIREYVRTIKGFAVDGDDEVNNYIIVFHSDQATQENWEN